MKVKTKVIIKILLLTTAIIIVVPIDGIMFAFINSCMSCSTFGQYLSSNVSLFQTAWVSLLACIALLKSKPPKV